MNWKSICEPTPKTEFDELMEKWNELRESERRWKTIEITYGHGGMSQMRFCKGWEDFNRRKREFNNDELSKLVPKSKIVSYREIKP